MLTTPITILDYTFTVEYTYHITAPAIPASGPTYSSGGEPATPMEYEIPTDFELYQDKFTIPLPIPPWLHPLILEHLLNSEDVYQSIEEDSQS